MYSATGGRGDLYIRLNVVLPDKPPAAPIVADAAANSGKDVTAELVAEEELKIEDGKTFRYWVEKKRGKGRKKKGTVREEL